MVDGQNLDIIHFTSEIASTTQTKINKNFEKLDLYKVDVEEGKGLSEKSYSATEQSKLAALPTNDELNTSLNNRPTTQQMQDYVTENGGKINIIKVNGTPQTITDKTVNITVPTTASQVSALPNTTKYGSKLELTKNTTTHVYTVQLKDQDGNALGDAVEIDLPIESLITEITYDENTKDLNIKLQNGTITTVPLDAIITGLVNENRTIAGIDLKDDITVAEMQTALNIPKIQEYAFESTAWTADTANPGYYVLYIENFTSSDVIHSLGVFKTVTYANTSGADNHAIMTDILINTYPGHMPTVKLRTDNPFKGVFKYLLTKA